MVNSTKRRAERCGDARRPRPAEQRGDRDRFCAADFALRVWKAIRTPVSHSLHALASAGEWEQVVRKDVTPSHYVSPLGFYLDYQSVKLVSKLGSLPTGIDRRAVAQQKFIDAEIECHRTNHWFRHCQATGVYPGCSAVLHAAQRKIADILGPVPNFGALDFAFGPGANFGVRRFTTPYHKLSSALESTHSMVPVLSDFLSEFPGWLPPDSTQEVALANGSDLTFVPKDAKTDRSICIEPLLNGLMQKGIGSYIRDRLLKHGVNLRDQTINQRLAADAERLELSTVDFSSASDTIAYGLVLDLLPPDWAETLDAARCPQYRAEGRWYPFQKFSSMGNAYTFELETLIFYALAYACCTECGVAPLTGVNLHVYGDDVIIPRVAFDRFVAVSAQCGFTTNKAKSYKTGPFFESCGTDAFLGTLVTPYRLKVDPTNIKELTYVANLVLRISTRALAVARPNEQTTALAVAHRLAAVHRWIVGFIPRHLRTYGPSDDETDDWLICPFDRALPSQGVFGWRHRRLVTSPVKFRTADGLWPMSYALYGAYRSRSIGLPWDDAAPVLWSDGVALREKVRYKLGVTWSSDWGYPLALAGIFWRGY